MTHRTQTLFNRANAASPFIARCATRFSPAEIRQAISELVAYEHTDMADALCEAGLALYPSSEDILSIAALLSELRQDWETAEQHLTKLLELQDTNNQAMVWLHLIRVVRCQLDHRKALQLAREAIKKHPTDRDLSMELADLIQSIANHIPSQAAEMAH